MKYKKLKKRIKSLETTVAENGDATAKRLRALELRQSASVMPRLATDAQDPALAHTGGTVR